MGFFNNFPYTNFHELNLDWLLGEMKKLRGDFETYAETYQLHYADPIFWDITKSYEPMTIVVDQNTNWVYMSRKPVPPGVQITDTDYWMPVGDITSIQNQLNALDGRMDDAENDIDDLQGDMNDAQGDIGDLQTDVGDLQTDVAALKVLARGNLKGRKCILIGDSYAYGTGGVVGQGWPYYFLNYSGMTMTAGAWHSGAGFVAKGNNDDHGLDGETYKQMTFEEMFDACTASLTSAQKDAVEYVICLGGLNDYNEYDGGGELINNASAVTSFIANARSTCKYANVIVLPVYCATIAAGDIRLTLTRVYRAASQIGASTTWKSIYWLTGVSTYGTIGGFHCEDAGYQRQAHLLLKFMLCGDADVYFGPGSIGLALSGDPVNNCSTVRVNNEVTLRINIHSDAGTVIASATTIGTLNEAFRPQSRIHFPVYAYSSGDKVVTEGYIDPDGTFKIMPGSINGIDISDLTRPYLYAYIKYNLDQL